MSQNLLELNSNYGKCNFIRTVFRCVVSLFICGVCLSPLTVNATGNVGEMGSDGIVVPPPPSWTQISGGGYTRGGGGTGRRYVETGYKTVTMTQGYPKFNNGAITVAPVEDLYNYVGVITLSSAGTPAGLIVISGMLVKIPQNTVLTFYNWNASGWVNLGSTPYINGQSTIEIPYYATHIVLQSSLSDSPSYRLISEVASEEASNMISPSSVWQYGNNTWLLGLSIDTTTGKMKDFAKHISSLYYYKISITDTLKVSRTFTGTFNYRVLFYDDGFVYLGSTLYESGDDVSFGHYSTAKYIKIDFNLTSLTTTVRADWIGATGSTLGMSRYWDSVDGSYSLDSTSKSTMDNYPIASTQNFNISFGDGNTVVYVDGDNNTIELYKPSTDYQPVEYVPVEYPATDTDSDDNDDGGFFDGIFESIADILKAIFSGLGNILSGILDILLIPVNFIVDSAADLLEFLSGIIASLGGLSEFFSQLFFFMPSPIPEMLLLFIPAILVVAIVKMFL